MTANKTWYVRRGNVVKGPFPSSQIVRYIALGRVKPDDHLSQDQKEWAEVRRYPKLMQLAETLPQQSVEERRTDRREQRKTPPEKNNRRQGERRSEEAEEDVERRERRERVLRSLREAPESRRGPILVVVALLLAVVATGLLWRTDQDVPGDPDCNLPPAPQVNWANCRMPGRDLSKQDLTSAYLRNSQLPGSKLFAAKLTQIDLAYADLSGADLSYAELQQASLKGADLKNADLSSARLDNSDLSYADLTGARLGGASFNGVKLDQAIWTDGTICANGSVAECVPLSQ